MIMPKPILTYADFVAQAGLVEAAVMTPPPYGWMTRAYISMGNRLHGDNLNSDWKTLYSGAPDYDTLTAMPWTDISGWFFIHPGAANTCTNSAVRLYDFQVQMYNLTTRAWELVSDPAVNREMTVSTWYDMPTQSVSGGTTDRIYYPGQRYNLPAVSTVPNSSNRSGAAELPLETTKFSSAHSALGRASGLDYTKIGGIAVLCRAKLISVDGNAFNGVSQMMLAIGADAYPAPNTTPGSGILTGVGIMPSMCINAFQIVGTTERPFMATTAKLTDDVIVQTTSDYQIANGANSQCMDADLFAANVPQFLV